MNPEHMGQEPVGRNEKTYKGKVIYELKSQEASEDAIESMLLFQQHKEYTQADGSTSTRTETFDAYREDGSPKSVSIFDETGMKIAERSYLTPKTQGDQTIHREKTTYLQPKGKEVRYEQVMSKEGRVQLATRSELVNNQETASQRAQYSYDGNGAQVSLETIGRGDIRDGFLPAEADGSFTINQTDGNGSEEWQPESEHLQQQGARIEILKDEFGNARQENIKIGGSLITQGAESVYREKAELVEVSRHKAGSATRAKDRETFDNRYEEIQDKAGNEDDTYIDKNFGIYGAFDGVGGYAGGGMASRIVRNALERDNKQIASGKNPEQIAQALKTTIEQAQNEMAAFIEQHPEMQKMASTATIVKTFENQAGNQQAIIANMGDSRLYRRKADGELEAITVDDSLQNDLTRYGMKEQDSDPNTIFFNKKFPNTYQATRELQKSASNATKKEEIPENRNIIRNAVNGKKDGRQPTFYLIDIQPGEELILTSDGVHDTLTDKLIEKTLAKAIDPEKKSALLVDLAYKLSTKGKQFTDEYGRTAINPVYERRKADDMSAVVIKIEKTAQALRNESQKRMDELRLRFSDLRISADARDMNWQRERYTKIAQDARKNMPDLADNEIKQVVEEQMAFLQKFARGA
jgi:PPM family protein phosphatase